MHILITAGPTREHIDDVRFLSNASSGRMGYAVARAALRAGHTVTLVTGPTHLEPPAGATVCHVTSAVEMHEAAIERFDACDGAIAVAAVADYRPAERVAGKMKKSADALVLRLVPNPDILADLARRRIKQWLVGFALESHDPIRRGREKLQRKALDLNVVNTPTAMASDRTQVTVLDAGPEPVAVWSGSKADVAAKLIELIDARFGHPAHADGEGPEHG